MITIYDLNSGELELRAPGRERGCEEEAYGPHGGEQGPRDELALRLLPVVETEDRQR